MGGLIVCSSPGWYLLWCLGGISISDFPLFGEKALRHISIFLTSYKIIWTDIFVNGILILVVCAQYFINLFWKSILGTCSNAAVMFKKTNSFPPETPKILIHQDHARFHVTLFIRAKYFLYWLYYYRSYKIWHTVHHCELYTLGDAHHTCESIYEHHIHCYHYLFIYFQHFFGICI